MEIYEVTGVRKRALHAEPTVCECARLGLVAIVGEMTVGVPVVEAVLAPVEEVGVCEDA